MSIGTFEPLLFTSSSEYQTSVLSALSMSAIYSWCILGRKRLSGYSFGSGRAAASFSRTLTPLCVCTKGWDWISVLFCLPPCCFCGRPCSSLIDLPSSRTENALTPLGSADLFFSSHFHAHATTHHAAHIKDANWGFSGWDGSGHGANDTGTSTYWEMPGHGDMGYTDVPQGSMSPRRPRRSAVMRYVPSPWPPAFPVVRRDGSPRPRQPFQRRRSRMACLLECNVWRRGVARQ